MGKHPGIRRARIALLALACLLAAQSTGHAVPGPSIRVPRGYSYALRQTVAPGLDRFVLVRRSQRQVANVARFTAGGRYALVPVLSQNRVAGPGRRTEPTSAMCRRVRCLVAVNGDFFARGVPVGGLVANAELLRSPAPGREQATVRDDGSLALGPLRVGVAVISTYKVLRTLAGAELPLERYETRSTTASGVNIPRGRDQIILYTSKFGPRTETRSNGVEVTLRVTSKGTPFRTDADTGFRPVAMRQGNGNGAVPRNGAVLSGHGEGARVLARWWQDVRTGKALPDSLLRVTSRPGAEQSISGNPVVLRGGERAFPNSSLARQRAPRTLLAWSNSGRVFLVTFDGRQGRYARGVTLAEAASFVRALGATEALNLDGGGSTTFVKTGRVANRPSDGRERSVAVALAVVRS